MTTDDPSTPGARAVHAGEPASNGAEPAAEETVLPPSLLFATVLVDELVRCGVRHVLISPGSRSAPLAYAALAAERAGRLAVHVRVDERAAAFTALGVGLATGLPAAVVTTSGTAVANLHPAVSEAHEGRVPLLLLTSDRPHELRPTRANQTTTQPGLFAGAPRLSLDLEAPERLADDDTAARTRRAAYWRGSVDRAVSAARGDLSGVPGPVHVNVSLRDPLAPPPSANLDARALPEPEQGRPDGAPWTRVAAGVLPLGTAALDTETRTDTGAHTHGSGVAHTANGHLTAAGPGLPHVPRTIVVLGHVPARVREAALRWARARRHPVLAGPLGADPAGETLPHGAMLAETDWAASPQAAPDRVLVVGRLTLSRAVAALVRRAPVRELVTPDPVWPDPSHTVQAVHPAEALLALAAPDSSGPTDPDAAAFHRAWHEAASLVGQALGRFVPGTWPSGLAVAEAVLNSLPDDARLFLGSSSTVRDVAFVRAPATGAGHRVPLLANRGLAGIDGCVSTAVGLALAEPRAPAYALVGDLTFLHDAAALTIGPTERRPDLTVVVVNDDGGAIFDTLEYGEPARRGADEQAYTRLFCTPTGTDLEALCAAHGARHLRAHSPEQLQKAVRVRPSGLSVVEVRLPGVRARRDRETLVAAVNEALATRNGPAGSSD